MTSFTSKLADLADGRAFPSLGQVDVRWGQLLRESPRLRGILESGRAAGTLIRLGDLGRLRGGTVTRANAYFIVDELPFESIPTRFRLTRRDWQRVAIVMDGLETPHRIERAHLRTPHLLPVLASFGGGSKTFFLLDPNSSPRQSL